MLQRNIVESGTPKAEIDDFMGLPLAEQKIRFFQDRLGSNENVRHIYQETDRTVSIEIERISIAYGGGHFFRQHTKSEKFVYNKEKRKVSIKTMGKETRRIILARFDQFDWLRDPDKYCHLPSELFCDSVTTKILLRKITNREQVCREYFKSLHLKGVDYKAYLALKSDQNGFNPLSRFPLTFLQEAFTDLNGALRLADADPATASILADMVVQAIALSKKINPRWSYRRLQAEHQAYTRRLTARKLEIKHAEPIHEALEGKETFPEYGARLLNNEKEVFAEGEEMSHCVYSCYFPRIKRKEYLAFSFKGDVRATLGLRVHDGKLFFDQAFGIRDNLLDSVGIAKIKRFLSDSKVERKLLLDTGLYFDDSLLRSAASWFGNRTRYPAPAATADDIPF